MTMSKLAGGSSLSLLIVSWAVWWSRFDGSLSTKPAFLLLAFNSFAAPLPLSKSKPFFLLFALIARNGPCFPLFQWEGRRNHYQHHDQAVALSPNYSDSEPNTKIDSNQTKPMQRNIAPLSSAWLSRILPCVTNCYCHGYRMAFVLWRSRHRFSFMIVKLL